jgi:ABC-2 type transport system permease protein
MRQIWSIATKELRGFFNSAVAVIFLMTFLLASQFLFFWFEKFFARNTADVRPLFEWLPLLLLFLVSALSMRLWSDEHKSGTIEILLTLPVSLWRLVAGKFVAGFLLVAVALALTLGLPITVSMMGEIDWGPVWGGYLAAMLLAAAYLSIGLFVSATTDNQIVALIVTALLCILFYLPGTAYVADLVGMEMGEILRLIGTGSRFESIGRGVLDLRDLAYYLSLIAIFLVLNVLVLQARRWSKAARWRKARMQAYFAVGLVAANALALNLWLSPVSAFRIDMTADKTYSLTAPTKKMLRSLDEPLIIRGYFSEETHPKLAPLVSQVRDMLVEYAAVGGSNVQVAFLDPSKSEELEKEAFEQYNIKSVPLGFSGRNKRAVVNSYFHILVAYGDKHEVLSHENLIEVEVMDMDDVQVRLKNLEYDVTKAIRKVVFGFQSVDSLFASLPGKVELLAYVTPDTLPENFKEGPEKLKTVAEELKSQSNGVFEYSVQNPSTDAEKEELFKAYGFKPYLVSPFSRELFYFHLLLRMGDKLEVVPLPKDLSERALRDALTDTLKRAAPGFIKVVGIVTPPNQVPPELFPGQYQKMGQQPQPQPVQRFQALRQSLQETYEVRSADLSSGQIADEIDVLILAGPEGIDDKGRKAVDQFLMRGGSLIVLAGKYRLDVFGRQGLGVKPVDSGLDSLLQHWGVTVKDKLVLDQNSDAFPVPEERDVGGMKLRRVRRLPYPYFIKVSQKAMKDGGVVTAGLSATLAHWATSLEIAQSLYDNKDTEVLDILKSSDDSWLQEGADVAPNFGSYPGTGFANPDASTKGPHLLGVAIAGSFDSAYKDETQPKAAGDGATGKEEAERVIARSPPDARLVVLASSGMASDELLQIGEQLGSREVVNNLQLVLNLIDWAAEDTELLAIRARGGTVRALTVDEDDRGKWEKGNYVLALLALAFVVVIARVRRGAAIRAAGRIIVPSGTTTSSPSDEEDDGDEDDDVEPPDQEAEDESADDSDDSDEEESK